MARAGGRVTAVNAWLGQNVWPGRVVVEIDGAGTASPARVQAATAAESLRAFEGINEQAIKSIENAVAIAELSTVEEAGPPASSQPAGRAGLRRVNFGAEALGGQVQISYKKILHIT